MNSLGINKSKKDTKVVLELARNKHAPPTYRELDVTYSLPYNSNA